MNYKDLNVYQRAYQAAINLHMFLNSKKSNVSPQNAEELRYLSREILANIAEGTNQRTPKSKRYLFFRALDSIRRIMMDLDFLVDLRVMPAKDSKSFHDEYEICAKQLFKLNQSVLNADKPKAETPPKTVAPVSK
jgi:hypothetical protein